MVRQRVVALALCLPFLLDCSGARAQTANDVPKDPCHGKGTSVVVLLGGHSLLLCKSGRSDAEYAVSLGKGGTGKTRGADNKTPVGTYALGRPRPSGKFGTFIPVGYPTVEQKKKGYTGQAIGIHGPARDFTWAGWLNTLFDWTQGCIAVESDEAISAIADWVRKEGPKMVHLLALPEQYKL